VFTVKQSPAIFETIFTGEVGKFSSLLLRQQKVDMRDGYDRTALMLACFYNRPEMVKALLARGADTNLRDKAGHTPLMMAVKYPRIVHMLLEKKAATNLADNSRRTALFYAIFGKVSEQTLRSLLAKGADLRQVEKEWPFSTYGFESQEQSLRKLQKECQKH